MPIADAIQLAISLQAPPVSAQGFGTLLLLTVDGSLPLNTPSVYTSASAILDDPASGIEATDHAYKAAVDAFAQPNVSRIAIARIAALQAKEQRVQIDTVSSGGASTWTATLTSQGLVYTAAYVEDGTPTVTEVRNGLKAALEAVTTPGPIPVTLDDDGVDAFGVEGVVGVDFAIAISNDADGTSTVSTEAPGVRVSTGAAAVYAVDPSSWYGIALPGAVDAQVFDLAEWVETVRKVHGATATGSGNKAAAADSLFVKLAAQSFVRTVPIYCDTGDYAGEAWIANRLAVNPDQQATTWAFVTLPSVTIGDETTTEQASIEASGGNYYGELGGLGAAYPGHTPGGQPPDLITTVDWLFFRLTERYQAIFLDASNRGSKVPYTDAGIGIFEAATLAQLQIGEEIGHFVPGSSSVDAPTLSEVSPADRVARTLRFAFATEPSGAIEKVVVSGSVAIPVT
jgi:hypothetical protein